MQNITIKVTKYNWKSVRHRISVQPKRSAIHKAECTCLIGMAPVFESTQPTLILNVLRGLDAKSASAAPLSPVASLPPLSWMNLKWSILEGDDLCRVPTDVAKEDSEHLSTPKQAIKQTKDCFVYTDIVYMKTDRAISRMHLGTGMMPRFWAKKCVAHPCYSWSHWPERASGALWNSCSSLS